MEILTLNELSGRPVAAAIGYFDGVHPGHRAVAEAAVKRAREQGVVSAAVTFSFEGFRPRGKGSADLMQRELCFEELGKLGIELVVELSMADTASLSPHEFCLLLKERINAESVFCGTEFRYGSGRAGDAESLKAEGKSLGFSVVTLEDVVLRGTPISTTRIKEHVTAGEPEKAAELLGRPFCYRARVVEEKHLARALGFPTANSRYPDIVKPRAGSYISRTTLQSGESFISVTNLGVRPTVQGSFFCSETHLLGFSGDLRGREITVELLEFLRPEKRFAGLDSLRSAIAADVAAAMLYASRLS